MRFIEGLRNFPDKWLLMILFAVVLALYLYTRTDFSGQLLQTIVGAILGIIGVRRNQVEASTESGDVTVQPDPAADINLKEKE
jgi:hypothetical protein